MSEISNTGWWNGETAHHHHVHCKELSKWICNFLNEKVFNYESIIDMGCFTGKSKIKTPKGNIEIKDLKEGMELMGTVRNG